MQKKYQQAVEMIDKACQYYYVFPKLYNLSQLIKGVNLINMGSKSGVKLIEDSLINLEKLEKPVSKKSSIKLIQEAKKLLDS